MSELDTLNEVRGRLFQTVNSAVNNGAFGLNERQTLNELLADPLAADHLLLAGGLSGKPAGALIRVTAALDAADARMAAVLAGANSRDERRLAIDEVDSACDLLTALLEPD